MIVHQSNPIVGLVIILLFGGLTVFQVFFIINGFKKGYLAKVRGGPPIRFNERPILYLITATIFGATVIIGAGLTLMAVVAILNIHVGS